MTSRGPEKRWEVTPGREVHRGGVTTDGKGGAVIVREGDRLRISSPPSNEPEIDYRDAISIRFEGPNADRSCWLQFLWAEVLIEDATGAVRRGTGKSPITSGRDEVELTTDPGSPKVVVDSGSTSSPCYERWEDATAERNGGRNAIWDRPSIRLLLSIVAGQASSTTRFVTAILHFTSYLVTDGVVVYTVHWTARARWDLGAVNTPDQVPEEFFFDRASRGGSLTAPERAALGAEYPDQEVLP